MEEQVLPIRIEAGSVGPPRILRQEGSLGWIVRSRTDCCILIVVEIILFDFGISGTKELQVVLLFLLSEVTHLEYVLVCTRLHLVCHILLP